MNTVFIKSLSLIATAVITFAPLTASAEGAFASGTFTGASDHIIKGGVQIVKTADGGAVVILDSDFSLDGAPDPRVSLGKDGKYVDAGDLGVLQGLKEVQVYVAPASVNVDDFNEVYIWCLKFGVPLGVAALG